MILFLFACIAKPGIAELSVALRLKHKATANRDQIISGDVTDGSFTSDANGTIDVVALS